MIVEEEQNGKERADYGKSLIQELSGLLTKEFGKGYSATNLKQIGTFFLSYQKRQTLSDESVLRSKNIAQDQTSETLSTVFNLSWSHYLRRVLKIDI